jgi:hypothetical protein
MFANLTDRISFAISGISRHQYLHRKADEFLSKVLPDIVKLRERGIWPKLNDGTEVAKITLHPQCNDTEYINILNERLQSCGFTVEINWKGPHFYLTLEVSF